jgi:hypothetical protein
MKHRFAETAGDYSSTSNGTEADSGNGAETPAQPSAPVFQEYLGAWKRVELTGGQQDGV